MTSIPTANIFGTVKQICGLAECGCEIVRLAVSNAEDVKSLAEIKSTLRRKGVAVPLVADVHFSPLIASDCLEVADKVRINAGNFSDKILGQKAFSDGEFATGREKLRSKLKVFFNRAKDLKKPVRIGINYGSLAPRIVYKFGHGEEAMWASAEECLLAAEEVNFEAIILSFKASDVQKIVRANRLACSHMDERGWNFPVHLGVTEAASGDYARVKSAVGIGTLLQEGIGDTIRVSLTEDPTEEIAVAKNILQACGLRRYGVELVACPSCGRTTYDIQKVLGEVRDALARMGGAKNFKVAVMGCAINGIGEAGDADFAIVGGPGGMLAIYEGGKCIATRIAPDKICEEFLQKCAGGRRNNP
jgi:(E)-4-hydroxy-3-methylbut-2-enyl-diphosphate synthase